MMAEDRRDLLAKANVVAVGRGIKISGGVATGQEAVIVSVSRKLPLDQLDPADVVPPEAEGLPTDVVETGIIRAFSVERERPAYGGDSIGHYLITAGTLGCVLLRGDDRVILSNNHVLANSNAAQIGDAILQPGPHDGGTSADRIATLLDFVPVEFDGEVPADCPIAGGMVDVANKVSELLARDTRLQAVRQAQPNLVDAAIARPLIDADVSDEIRGVGLLAGAGRAELGMALTKSGRTTNVTQGEVLQVDVTVRVQYGAGQIATFEDQVMAGAMSQPGDSGSAVLDADRNLVGLLFAGSDTSTVFCRSEHVLEAFGLHL